MRLLALLLTSLIATSAMASDRRIAITFDDLPWARLGDKAPVDLGGQHAALIAALRIADITGVGFVNAGKLEINGIEEPARVAMLDDWLDAGFTLGNHTFGHVDLHAVGREAYEADILRGDATIRRLLAARGQVPAWFRHPYLRAGRSVEDREAVADFLAMQGYRIAPVTIDNSDWIWARAYVEALASGDLAAQAQLRVDFVPYLLAKVRYYEKQSAALFGAEPPQVLLLHANELNAATFTALATALRARGYRFIGLEEALRDPAYAHADGYTGAYGPSWIHRWAMAERRPPAFYAGEPETPRWVLTLAGVQSE